MKAAARLPLVLGSASPRRRRLLGTLPWPFRVRVSGVPEPDPRGRVDPARWATRLALKKARAVAAELREGLVLGADTIVYRGGRVFNKPLSQKSARRMLAELTGKWHAVYTGLALVAKPGGRAWTTVSRTRVKMRLFDGRRLDRWSRRNHDKAGAYSAQAGGSPFVERFVGDFDNVVGLPRRGVRELLKRARKAGFKPG